MRQHRSTWVLLLLAIGLGAWLYWDRNAISQGEKTARARNVFSAWRKDQVSRLSLVRDGDTLVLDRDVEHDGPWTMSSPVRERADQAAVERLLTTLEFAASVRPVAKDGAFGFDSPRATGSVTMGPLTFRLVLGGPSPRPEGSSYLRVDDGPTLVVSKEVTDALLSPSDRFRDRTVVPYLSLDLRRLDLAGTDVQSFSVERLDARAFRVLPSNVRASRLALDKVWGALSELRAQSFAKIESPPLIAERAAIRLVFTPNDATRPVGEILIGGSCPGKEGEILAERTKPTRLVACIPQSSVNELRALSPDALVDTKAFSLRYDEIEEVRVESASPVVELGASEEAPRRWEVARKAAGYVQREPGERELTPDEADAVTEWLAALDRPLASAIRRLQDAPFVPRAKVTVRGGQVEEVVEIGTVAPDSWALRRSQDQAVFEVSRDTARTYVPMQSIVRPRVVLGDERRVTELSLGCGVRQVFRDAGEGLRLVEPSGYETDASVSLLVEALTRGKALRWVSDRDDKTFFPSDSETSCQISLSFSDGKNPKAVRFGRPIEGGVAAAIEGAHGVFVAPPSLVDLARRIYVSHASLRFSEEQAKEASLTVRGQPVPWDDDSKARETLVGWAADRVVMLGPGARQVLGPVVLMIRAKGKQIACGEVVNIATGSVRRCMDVAAQSPALVEVSARHFEALSKRLGKSPSP